jgi:hypothetical protein
MSSTETETSYASAIECSTPSGLGMWVTTQRLSRATMTPERKTRFEALGWWVWDTRDALDDAWSTSFGVLVAFYEANGSFPTRSTPGGLGAWVNNQRATRATIGLERKARLETLGWWVWRARGAASPNSASSASGITNAS